MSVTSVNYQKVGPEETCFADCRGTIATGDACAISDSVEHVNGVPGEIRTPDLPLRRGPLYPAELPGRNSQHTV
jgi:hypothetical protein